MADSLQRSAVRRAPEGRIIASGSAGELPMSTDCACLTTELTLKSGGHRFSDAERCAFSIAPLGAEFRFPNSSVAFQVQPYGSPVPQSHQLPAAHLHQFLIAWAIFVSAKAAEQRGPPSLQLAPGFAVIRTQVPWRLSFLGFVRLLPM